MKFKYLILVSLCFFISCRSKESFYACSPCELVCDDLSFEKPGFCPHCNMLLIKKDELSRELEVNEITIIEGGDKFLIEGGSDKNKTIEVYYYKPKNFNANSKVLLVLPGAGRNGRNYRDAWVEAANKYGVLILSLTYPENDYPGLWSYNLAGMITNVDVKNKTFDITDRTSWLFDDFDRIFNEVKKELDLKTDSYDMFGHSAGGQILHRLAIFKAESKANRIIAANSGWYTLPLHSEDFPYGLKGVSQNNIELYFNTNLTIFLGENDNAVETRGHLRHGQEVDKQGLYRLARGKYFYELSQGLAKKKEKKFDWQLEIIPDVGHDYQEISKKAAIYLYQNK